MKVLFFCNMPELGATSRYRAYRYAHQLNNFGISCQFFPPYGNRLAQFFDASASRFTVFLRLIITIFNRIRQLFYVPCADIVFIQRELLEIFPNYLERIVAKLNAAIVYDFDDAIYKEFRRKKGGLMTRLVDSSKTMENIKLGKCVIAGNTYLADYARQFNSNVFVIPTPVDIFPQIKQHGSHRVTIGWIGSSVNLLYLDLLQNVFLELKKKFDFLLRVVSNKDYHSPNVEVVNKKWRLEDEIDDLLSFDIGIMPLLDNEYTRGKCGFKILQYMAAGVPVVCSPVGINQEIVIDRVNGYTAHSPAEWIEKLSILIQDVDLRQRLGREGRKTVEQRFSRQVLFPNFLAALQSAANFKKHYSLE